MAMLRAVCRARHASKYTRLGEGGGGALRSLSPRSIRARHSCSCSRCCSSCITRPRRSRSSVASTRAPDASAPSAEAGPRSCCTTWSS
eukprot:scaffold32901_cov118-Isochrysis_galbana.AAC.2